MNGMMLFVQQVVNGLRLGSIYALVALGYTMVYGIIRLINFAHGDFIMVGGFAIALSLPFVISVGLPAWTSVFIAIAVCVAVGVSVEKLAYNPVRKRGTKMSTLITAIAMSTFLQNAVQAIFGANPRNIGTLFSFPSVAGFDGNTVLTIIICGVIMIALQLFVKYTRTGKAMRAVSEDKEAAVLMGINVNRTITTTFAIGSGLAAIASLMFCAQYNAITITTGNMLGLKAFVAAVLGGIGIIPGAMLGGFVIGMIESLSKGYIAVLTGGFLTSAFSDAIVFSILIIVLLVKPVGILGRNIGEKV